MPTKPLRLCAFPGCSNLVKRDRCAVHTRQLGFARFDRSREDAYRGDWPAIRKRVLAEEPVCTLCHSAPSTEADHIVPVRLGGASTRENARGVCKRCNLRRAAEESAAVRRAEGGGRSKS